MRRFIERADDESDRQWIQFRSQDATGDERQLLIAGMKGASEMATETNRAAPGVTGAVVIRAVRNTDVDVACGHRKTVRRNEHTLKQNRDHSDCHGSEDGSMLHPS